MSDVICVISKRTGRIMRAIKGDEDFKRGDICVVESDLGGDLAEVVDTNSPVCRSHKSSRDAVKIIRKAREDDESKFSWLQKKE